MVDFLLNDSLAIEMSTATKGFIQAKITELFLKAVDITKLHPEIKFALVFSGFSTNVKRGHKVFPTSQFKTAIAFGFPILSSLDIEKLVAFSKGNATAEEISDKPDFIRVSTAEWEKRIKVILDSGVFKRKELAAALKIPPGRLDDIVKRIPGIIQRHTYFGRNDDQVMTHLLQHTSTHKPTDKMRQSLSIWLIKRMEKMFQTRDSLRARDLALELRIPLQRAAALLHSLQIEEKIVKVSPHEYAIIEGFTGHSIASKQANLEYYTLNNTA